MVKTSERLCAVDMNNGVTFIGSADFSKDIKDDYQPDKKTTLILKRFIAYHTQSLASRLDVDRGRTADFKMDHKELLRKIYNGSYRRSDGVSLNLENYVAFYLLIR
ncbi:hypothetical protein J4466_05415 [Candidatus Pacearchaeota archaeon]|nr:hypothetical protein [Candidatus Pacearchaeota archaeon]